MSSGLHQHLPLEPLVALPTSAFEMLSPYMSVAMETLLQQAHVSACPGKAGTWAVFPRMNVYKARLKNREADRPFLELIADPLTVLCNGDWCLSSGWMSVVFPKFKFPELRCEVHRAQHPLALLCIVLLGAWYRGMRFMVFCALRTGLCLRPDNVMPSAASYKMPDKPTC